MINIISSCTSSKKYSPSNLLELTNIDDHLLLEDACDLWINNININESTQYKASQLYKGAAWKVTLDIKEILDKKTPTNLYVASAGYGLIHSDKKIYSYDCTFSPGDSNSISKFNNYLDSPSNILWWDRINTFSSDSFPIDSYFFIVLPHDYLVASQNFIQEIIYKHNKKVFIFVANKKSPPSFMDKNIIKFDSRFNSFQTGVMINILQRAVFWLSNEIVMKNIPLCHKDLQNHIDMKLAQYKAFTMPVRKQLSEKEICEKIRLMILYNNISSATQGLKYFRQLGFACEQKRFGKLFKEIKCELG